jgi:hypothetical protein
MNLVFAAALTLALGAPVVVQWRDHSPHGTPIPVELLLRTMSEAATEATCSKPTHA